MMKKIKVALVCLGMGGAVVLGSVAAHAEIQPLTEQEMLEVRGAGNTFSACNTRSSCQGPCCDDGVGGSYKLNPVSNFYICGGIMLPFSCSDNKNLECGQWTQFEGPGCQGLGQNAGYECATGCDGTTCGNDPGYKGTRP